MAQLLSESSPVVSVFSNVVNHIQQNGFVIANNSTNPNTQIDLDKGGQIWVHDPSDETVGEIVDVPSATGAFDISTSGADGLIDGTTVGTNTWYELGVIGDSSGSNAPALVGWTHTSTTNNTPTASSDLPSGYDLVRSLGRPRNSFIRTNANSNIYEQDFAISEDGYVIWGQEANNQQQMLINASSVPTSVAELQLDFVPPVNCSVVFGNLNINMSNTTSVGLHHNDSFDAEGNINSSTLAQITLGVGGGGNSSNAGVAMHQVNGSIFYKRDNINDISLFRLDQVTKWRVD